MRRILLIAVVLLLRIIPAGYAQMVGPNVFLPGHWLEIGINNLGAFGATPPAGYHASPAGTPLAEVWDYCHGAWNSCGTPPIYGDYTYPGTPYEGWGIQVGGPGGLNWAFTDNFGFTGPGSLTGANVSYVNAGGRLAGNWRGTTAGGNLTIDMETRVDTNANCVVMTVFFKNIGGTPLNNIYYIRDVDPDNDEVFSGSFATDNVVDYQNDVDHRVQVHATGMRYTSDYLGLCTKDCRAKALWHSSWPIDFYATDLATVYAGTAPIGTTSYVVGVHMPGISEDWAMGLIYNLGNLAPGASTVISYAYTFNGVSAIDSAFPEPLLVVDGIPAPPSGPAPSPTIDTFDVCAHPGMTILPVDVAFSEDKDWTYSTWTWSPGTGLSATTGSHVVITTTGLPPVITYTITGSDSAMGMYSCNTRVMYLTIKTCNKVSHNNPCFGDTLYLFNHGDSTSATYYWWGPGGFTSTLQNPFIYPAVYANAGVYHVIKTVFGVSDTDSTAAPVIIHHKPAMVVTSNSPLCSGMVDTLFMFVNPDSATDITWVGPAGFTSTLTNPSIPGFIAVNAGTYTVYGVTPFGCRDTETTTVAIVPPPPPPGITGIPAYCFGSTFIPFTVTGSNILWYPTAGSTVGTPIPPAVDTRIPGTYTYYATQTYGCLSLKNSITITIYPRINPNFTFTVRNGCDADTVYFTNISTNSSYYSWNFGDFTTDSASAVSTPLMHVFHDHSIHNVKLTGHNPVCSGDTTIQVDTRHEVKAAFSPLPDPICLGQGTTLSDSSYSTVGYGFKTLFSHTWTFGDGTSDMTNGTPPVHTYTAPGIYPVHLVVMDSLTCIDSVTRNVYVLQVNIKSFHDTALCISQPLALKNTVSIYPNIGLLDYTYSWSPAIHLDDTTAQIPFFSGFGLVTYTLTATEKTYGCIGTDTIRINSVLGKKLLNLTADQIITYGNTVQMNADNEVLYWWKPDNGTLDNTNINNPIAKPTATTQYTVYGYDDNGCLDSAFINIIVDSSMVESVPSAFTPNGDGLNDIFRPVGMKYRQLVDFRVFNRWGEQVFYSSSAKNGWDGTYKGEAQEMGVYYYTITVARPGGEGENIIYKGEVTLIR